METMANIQCHSTTLSNSITRTGAMLSPRIGTGEIFGGGIASVIAGRVEMTYGIEYSTHLAAIALVVGLVAPLSLNETAPAKVS